MIRRRASLIGALATALPFAQPAVSATTQAKVFRVGVLESEREVDEYGWKEFVAELSRLGFVEGRNVVFIRRAGELEATGGRRESQVGTASVRSISPKGAGSSDRVGQTPTLSLV